jgi:hypothetical protein
LVTPWLIFRWLLLILRGFHRAHCILSGLYPQIEKGCTGHLSEERIRQVHFYLHCLSGQTLDAKYIVASAMQYSIRTGRLLWG